MRSASALDPTNREAESFRDYRSEATFPANNQLVSQRGKRSRVLTMTLRDGYLLFWTAMKIGYARVSTKDQALDLRR